MILGRTTDGKIQIKQDPLRAVNCACCGSECGFCAQVAISGELLNVLRNATFATCDGIEGFFEFTANGFEVFFDYASAAFSYDTGCFICDSTGSLESTGDNIFHSGDCVDICNQLSPPTCMVAPDFLINGISFRGYYEMYEPGEYLPPPPIFVFS